MAKALLDILLEKNLLTVDEAQGLKIAVAKSPNKTYVSLIREQNLVEESDLVQAQGESYNVPFVDLEGISIPATLVSKVAPDVLKRYIAVPVEETDQKIKMVMANPVDLQAVQSLRTIFGKEIETAIGLPDQILGVIDKQSGEAISSEVSQALEDVEGTVADITDTIQDVSTAGAQLANAPVARIVNTILELAVKLKSSDVHIEPQESNVRIRFRINGVLVEKMTLPKSLKASIVSRIKILAKLKIDEKRLPQDGRIPVKAGNQSVDLRVSTMPSVYGEKVVLRLLERTGGVPELETSGIRGNAYKIYMEAIKRTNGIVLVTGPTGSGKSTTLGGTLAKLNKPGVNIITLEDPVEIRISGITQVQMNSEIGLTFATGLRAVLRQDPDIVMVGEIRDQETAKLAVQAALTGHLVLSTLHTNNAGGTLPRLLDMGVEPYLIASTVHCVVAQRLPRTICPYCREEYLASSEVVEDVKKVLNWEGFSLIKYLKDKASQNASADPHAKPPNPEVKSPPATATDEKPEIYLYRGKGCEKCDGTGYSGRIGILEVMNVSEKISKLIMQNKTSADIQNQALDDGMVSMVQDGYMKALEGITTIEEVLRVARD